MYSNNQGKNIQIKGSGIFTDRTDKLMVIAYPDAITMILFLLTNWMCFSVVCDKVGIVFIVNLLKLVIDEYYYKSYPACLYIYMERAMAQAVPAVSLMKKCSVILKDPDCKAKNLLMSFQLHFGFVNF